MQILFKIFNLNKLQKKDYKRTFSKSKAIIFVIAFVLSYTSFAQVYTSYLWHLQQPIYWPDKSVSNPYEYQKVWESYNLKLNGQNNDVNGLSHPLNNLEEIFSKPDRVNVYQWEAKNAIQRIANLPEAGAQVNYGGSLIENINSLATVGKWGYQKNWQQNIIQGQNMLTNHGYSRMDITGFTWHHALSPLISDRVFKKELEAHKYLVKNNFNGTISKGYWPAECAFSERIIKVLVEEGYTWSVIANSHLARTLNDYETHANLGTSGINIDYPNKSDKVLTKGVNWFNGQIDGRGGSFAAPYCYQAHKAKYVDPETGIEYKIDVVPMADLLSYRDGFSEQGTGEIDTNIAPFNDNSHPSIVLLAHDGDNAWGGGSSYYNGAVQNFTNAANDWGHPQFINWLWPMYTSNYKFDPNGWTEDARNWAVLTAAENFVVMAEDLEPDVQIKDIVNPTSSSSNTELAWHFLLPGYTSGYMYYGTAEDMEVKQTIASNNAVGYAQKVITAHAGTDNTPPSVFVPQRYPYNPGAEGFGPTYNYKLHKNSTNFTVWTFAFDVNGIASATVKYRTDNDGVNPLDNNDNDTYAGGSSVGAWQDVTMNKRIFPKGNVTNNPNVDFFVLPNYIANEYYAEITGLSEVLVDYYIEVTDTNGNTKKSKIQHVWVGKNQATNPTLSIAPLNNYDTTQIDVTITASDDKPNPTIYYTTDGSLPNVNTSASISNKLNLSITSTTTIKAIAVDANNNQSDLLTKTFYIGSLPNFSVYFKPPSNWTVIPKIYYWNAIPSGNLNDATWPGLNMTDAGSGWFKYDFFNIASTNIIFDNGNSGNANQTADLYVDNEAWYDWSLGWVPPQNLSNPTLTITPLQENYTVGDTVNILISAQDNIDVNPVIYYTLDGSTPTTQSTSAIKNISFNITKNADVNAFAKDSDGYQSQIITKNYIFNNATAITVYFKPPINWPIPKVYWWDELPLSVRTTVSWPGVDMQVYDGEWYKHKFDGAQQINVIFNNGNSGSQNQTEDLKNITKDLWYDWNTGVLAISKQKLLNSKIKLYPNPVQTTFSLNKDTQSVKIYDLLGRLVKQFNGQFSKDRPFDVQFLAPSVYLLQIETADAKLYAKKLVKY